MRLACHHLSLGLNVYIFLEKRPTRESSSGEKNTQRSPKNTLSALKSICYRKAYYNARAGDRSATKGFMEGNARELRCCEARSCPVSTFCLPLNFGAAAP